MNLTAATCAAMLSAVTLMASCASSPSGPVQFSGMPEAPAAYDKLPAGVYRGVIAASTTSGTFEVTLEPEGTASGRTAPAVEPQASSTAQPHFSFSLSRIHADASDATGASRASVVETARQLVTGTSTVSAGTTTLTYRGSVGGALSPGSTATFAVNLSVVLGPDGSVARVECAIDGAPAAVVATKELSTRQVVTFQGTYRGTDSGTWNMLIAGNSVFAAFASIDGVTRGALTGARSSDSLQLAGPQKLVTAAGVIVNETSVAGSWAEQIGDPGQGTFEGHRSSV